MKITPLEIRQKSFEKKLRGYDKDEVNAFLLSLSTEWEHVQDELKELKIKYQNSTNEVKKLREVESSLYKTLKTAEDTGANLIDQANKSAELHLRETQMNADGLLNEAKSRARTTIEDAEDRARQIMDQMEDKLRAVSQDYKDLENLRDNIISELKNLSTDTLQRVDRISSSVGSTKLDDKVKKIRQDTGMDAVEPEKKSIPVVEKTGSIKKENAIAEKANDSEDASFFDAIE